MLRKWIVGLVIAGILCMSASASEMGALPSFLNSDNWEEAFAAEPVGATTMEEIVDLLLEGSWEDWEEIFGESLPNWTGEKAFVTMLEGEKTLVLCVSYPEEEGTLKEMSIVFFAVPGEGESIPEASDRMRETYREMFTRVFGALPGEEETEDAGSLTDVLGTRYILWEDAETEDMLVISMEMEFMETMGLYGYFPTIMQGDIATMYRNQLGISAAEE